MSEYTFKHFDVPRFAWLDENPLIARNIVRDANNVHEITFEFASGLESEIDSIQGEESKSTITPSISAKERLWASVRSLFSKDSAVVELWAHYSDDSANILILTEVFDWEASRRIFQLEKQLISAYNKLDFEFSVLSLEGADSSEIVSDLVKIYPL